MNDGPDALAFVHQVERFVDLVQGMLWVMKVSSGLALCASTYGSSVRPFTPPDPVRARRVP